MPTEYQLIQQERLSAIVAIMASILLLLASNAAVQTLFFRQRGINARVIPSSTDITFIAVLFIFMGNLIFATTATARLRQRQALIQTGQDRSSLLPNILFAAGGWVSVFIAIFYIIGAQIRVNEQTQITIV